MYPFLYRSLKLACVAVIVLLASACEEAGPLERAGETLDESVDEIRDGADDVRDRVEDTLGEARDELEKAKAEID